MVLMLLAFLGSYTLMIIMSFYFSGIEAGFLALNIEKFKNDILDRNVQAQRVEKLVNAKDTVLGTVLLGNNLVNNIATLLGSFFCIFILRNKNLDYLLAIITTIVLLLMGEVLPKIVFKTYANKLVYRLGYYLYIFRIVFYPFVFILVKISDLLLWPIKLFSKKKNKLSKNDFSELIVDSLEEGLVEEEEKHFIQTIVNLSKTKVVEVMTPLNDLIMLNSKQDISSINITDTRKSSPILPIYEGRIDNITGYVRVLNVFKSAKSRKKVSDFQKEAKYIPETTMVDRVYELFNETGEKAFIVVNEYGGCSGMITEQDIIDRIFGFNYAITPKNSSAIINQINKNTYEIDTSFDIDELNMRLNVNFPKQGYETLGGLINNLFGVIPKVGSSIKWLNCTFTILERRKTAVDKVLLNISR